MSYHNDARARIRESIATIASRREHVGYDEYRPPHHRWNGIAVVLMFAGMAVIVAVVAFVVLWMQPAEAAEPPRCGRAEDVRKVLSIAGEEPILRAVVSSGDMFEVWSSVDGITWTAATTSPSRIMCIVGMGRNVETFKPMAKTPGVPA